MLISWDSLLSNIWIGRCHLSHGDLFTSTTSLDLCTKKYIFSNFLMFALDLKAIPPYKDHTEQTLKHQSNTKELVLMLCCLTSTVSPPKGGTWTHSKYYSRRLTAFYGQCLPWPTWCPKIFTGAPLYRGQFHNQFLCTHTEIACPQYLFSFKSKIPHQIKLKKKTSD